MREADRGRMEEIEGGKFREEGIKERGTFLNSM